MLKLGTCRFFLGLAWPFAMAVLAASPALAAAQEIILFTFKGHDGQFPIHDLIQDKAGNLYGTTGKFVPNGSGLIFTLTKKPNGKYAESELYRFGSYPDGDPSGLIRGKRGGLYGTTPLGGQASAGEVFKIMPDGSEKVLYSFPGIDGSDAFKPGAGVIKDKAHNLYGTTSYGGTYGKGVVYKLTRVKGAGYTESVLHSFGSGNDGATPGSVLTIDEAGNLYGTTIAGGTGVCPNVWCGTVYKVTPDGHETVLHNFKGESDGYCPCSGMIEDRSGNLYGTTEYGGARYNGVVFKLAPDGTETVLHTFTFSDGAYPMAGVIADAAGNLYGTTEAGGASNDGVVFKVATDGTETVLHSFAGGSDGAQPDGGVIADEAGNLFGTTFAGGTGRCDPHSLLPGCGVVFEIKNGQSRVRFSPNR